MATLESAFNPTYSENASILTGKPNRVDVEVEDTIDKAFWEDLLSELCPQKEFHFYPFHTVLDEDNGVKQKGKGKSLIIKASSEFSAKHIGCVDSDYDWLLSDYTVDGQNICNNKYLLQTYAYSIENLMCLSSTLKDFCYDVTEESVDFDFEGYLSNLSEIVYPLLVRSAYLYKENNMAFSPKDWRQILVNTERDANASLEQIRRNTEEAIRELDKLFDFENEDFDEFQKSILSEKDVSKESAYLYVRGHELFDHLLHSVLSPVVTTLRRQHYQHLQESYTKEDERRKALREYQTKDISVRELISRNYLYKNQTPIYGRIRNDVLKVWR